MKYCANILIFSNFLGRKVSLESNNVIVEKYTPNAKYPMDYFYPGPPLDQSGSNSSTSQYRVSLFLLMYISLMGAMRFKKYDSGTPRQHCKDVLILV